MAATLQFYRVNDSWGEFSNFYPSPIVLKSMIWPTVEHYFQASKFTDYKIQDAIRQEPSPMKAANMGRAKHPSFRSDWQDVRDQIMKDALRAKFRQHPKLMKLLLSTQDAMLVEHTVNDTYWADGGNGTGQNMLGKLLMDLRTELQGQVPDPNAILPPWVSFPSTDPSDLFWRMGLGEDYLTAWQDYESCEGGKWLLSKFPVPKDWQ